MPRLNLAATLARAAILAAAMLAASPLLPGEARAGEVTALVPAYFYPTWWAGSPWDALNAAAAKIPIEAIMNPASGPGDRPNPDYRVAVGALRKAGGKVIGYVSTGYGSRTVADVLDDVRDYLAWYHVDGIFLDEMGNQRGGLDYGLVYASIKSMAAGAGRDLHVVGNAGMPFPQVEAYLDAADTLVIFEGPLKNADPNGASFQSYPHSGPYAGLPPWFLDGPRGRFANLVYGVPTASAMAAALVKAVSYNAGYVFLTDDRLPNPWDTLPSYWDREVSVIALLNSLLKEE